MNSFIKYTCPVIRIQCPKTSDASSSGVSVACTSSLRVSSSNVFRGVWHPYSICTRYFVYQLLHWTLWTLYFLLIDYKVVLMASDCAQQLVNPYYGLYYIF